VRAVDVDLSPNGKTLVVVWAGPSVTLINLATQDHALPLRPSTGARFTRPGIVTVNAVADDLARPKGLEPLTLVTALVRSTFPVPIP
jgi:hypothetical protein